MRALAATGIAVALAAVSGGAEAREVSIYRGPCGEFVLPSGPTGLESAITIDTSCGKFVAGGDGVRFVGPLRRGPKYDGLVSLRGRLAFYDRNRVLWRSRGKNHRPANWVAKNGRSLAWFGGRMYIADLGGPERRVGRFNEHPLGWMRTGLLATVQENLLRARTRSGRLVRILDERAGSRTFDPVSRTLLYVSRGRELFRTDGGRTQRLASLKPLRLGRWFEIVPLQAGRVALVGTRLVILSSDGSVVASDRRRGSLPALSSHGAIAMISTGPLDGHGRARESVRLLRPGDRSSTLLHVNEVGALGCGHWPSLEWRGDDLLYSTTEGHVGVIDPGSGGHLDLSAVVGRLPGDFFQARWS